MKPPQPLHTTCVHMYAVFRPGRASRRTGTLPSRCCWHLPRPTVRPVKGSTRGPTQHQEEDASCRSALVTNMLYVILCYTPYLVGNPAFVCLLEVIITLIVCLLPLLQPSLALIPICHRVSAQSSSSSRGSSRLCQNSKLCALHCPAHSQMLQALRTGGAGK